jgi:uncharacterized protein (TIGR02466 family)
MIINQIFSNFVLEDDLCIDLIDLREKIYTKKNLLEHRIASNIGGWQSKDIEIGLFSKELEEEILRISQIGFSYLGLKNLEPKINDSWININYKNNFNDRHMHKGSILSGVFYVSTNINSGQIIFYNPNDKLSFFISSNIIEKFNFVNSSIWHFDPHDNLLLLFPSWLEHQVMPNTSQEDRISIAFNVGI